MRNTEILPAWAPDDPLRQNVFFASPSPRHSNWLPRIMVHIPDSAVRLFRRYGIIALAIAALVLWTAVSCAVTAAIVRRSTTEEVTEAVTLRMEAEMDRRLTAQEIAFRTENLLSDGKAMQIAEEADMLARLAGPMKTKRMKRTIMWNAIVRKDSPAFPDSLAAVLAVPDQWIFYKPTNPIRESDREIALEIVTMWHDGIYPEDLQPDDVFGEWSENDYVLRNTLEKGPDTHYWRAPEK